MSRRKTISPEEKIQINKLLKQSSLQAPGIQKRIAELKAQTEQMEQEIDEILMEKLR